MAELLIKKEWTRQMVLDAHEAGGRKRGRTAGSWVDEIASQKKAITLCQLCKSKFDPRKVGYREEREFPICLATCDGCSDFHSKCQLYIYGELYSTVRSTKEERAALVAARKKRVKLTGSL